MKYPIETRSQFWSHRRLTLVWNGNCDDLFFNVDKISSRTRHRDLIITRLETSVGLFLVKAKDHLESIYKPCICIGFKLDTYYHYITRQSNSISFNKLNILKYGNNAEIMQIWFSIKCQTKAYLFPGFKILF